MNKFQSYKESWKTVIPNCGNIQCLSLNLKSKYQGWGLKTEIVASKRNVLKRKLHAHEESEKKQKKRQKILDKKKSSKRNRKDKSPLPKKKRKIPPKK